MKINFGLANKALPYLGLLFGAAVIFWSFYRSEEYRTQTNLVFSQTYEILWRAAQIRETAANVVAAMEAQKSRGAPDVRLQRELQILKFNIGALLNLPYFDKFLGQKDAENLNHAGDVISDQILPALRTRLVDDDVLGMFETVRSAMYDATGTAISSSRDLSETADIEDGARSNFVIFSVVLALVIFGTSIWLIQAGSTSRHSDFLKSFSSLHVHTTRSRLYALVLFIRRIKAGEPVPPTVVDAAERAATELSIINEGLLHIAATKRPKELVQLWTILQQLSETHPGHIREEVSNEASQAQVASPHIFLILDELVENARRALEAANRDDSAVVVRAKVATDFLLRKSLAIEVVDHGIGMSPEVKAEALDPFFSTRAGTHVGLGLTGCAEMLRALGGKLHIISKEGQGTTVKVLYPLHKVRMEQELVNEEAS